MGRLRSLTDAGVPRLSATIPASRGTRGGRAGRKPCFTRSKPRHRSPRNGFRRFRNATGPSRVTAVQQGSTKVNAASDLPRGRHDEGGSPPTFDSSRRNYWWYDLPQARRPEVEFVKRTWDFPGIEGSAEAFLRGILRVGNRRRVEHDALRQVVVEWVRWMQASYGMPARIRRELVELGLADDDDWSFWGDYVRWRAHERVVRTGNEMGSRGCPSSSCGPSRTRKTDG